MRNLRATITGQARGLTRRQVIGAAGGGALLGSAWAALFRDAVLADEHARVTLARSGTALGALIAHRGHRIMVIHAHDRDGAAAVTELAAGFMRRRIDCVLLPASAQALFTRELRDRWRVRDLWLVPDRADASSGSLIGRSLRVGGLRIEAAGLPRAAWKLDTPATTPWCVDVTSGGARLTVASDREALVRMPRRPSLANAVACMDLGLDLSLAPSAIDVFLVPFEAVGKEPVDPRIVELASDSPVAIELRDDGITLPGGP